ncbi:MAG: GyrI-like domain-containing protein [Methanobacteriaceae archaeon]
MAKLDLKKENKEFYYPSKKEVSVVNIPKMKFLMIDGIGDPNSSQEYQDAMETLFPVAYKTKFISKNENKQDYVVMPLEGLWWVEDMREFSIKNKDSWNWTIMIRQPDFIDKSIIEKAIGEVKTKKNPPSISKIRFETFDERSAAQIMHIGPYGEAKAPTVAKIHEYIESNGYTLNGKHHEIYISDVRRTKPENLKTVIRQGFK